MGKTSRSKLKSQPKNPEPPEELFSFKAQDGIDYKLTMQEQMFCLAYLQNRGYGVEAIYTAGYNVKDRRVAAALASQMLKKSHIIAFINFKLQEYGYNDDSVDIEHNFLIKQYGDLNAKARGIDMYRKMKGQYAATKHIFADDNDDLTDDELDAEIARRKTTG